MFSEITNDSIRITRLRKLSSEFPIIQAVIEGSQRGQIFANLKNELWILHKAGFSEVFTHSDAGTGELVEFVKGSKQLPAYFHIYNCPEKLTAAFEAQGDFTVRMRKRIQLVCDQMHELNKNVYESDTFDISPVTRGNFDLLSTFNLDLSHKFWNSKEEFVDKALAVCAFDLQQNPVSICYAAAVAGKKAEIDVFTLESLRGQGIAKRVVQAFVRECEKKGIIPNWDCFEDNIKSLSVSLSLGFVKKKTYQFISLYRK